MPVCLEGTATVLFRVVLYYGPISAGSTGTVSSGSVLVLFSVVLHLSYLGANSFGVDLRRNVP